MPGSDDQVVQSAERNLLTLAYVRDKRAMDELGAAVAYSVQRAARGSWLFPLVHRRLRIPFFRWEAEIAFRWMRRRTR